MAPISDFQLTLVDGVLNLSTTDTSFHDIENQIYLEFKNVPYTTGAGLYLDFSSDGTQSYQLPDWFNYVPLNIDITINDDEDPQLGSLYDSKFYYNITSSSNDLFDPTNVLSEGKYVDITDTDRAYLSFDNGSLSIENINGENFLNISGKIENYQSLIDAHGQLSRFERINYHVEDVKDGTSSGYDFHLEFQKPVDTNNTGDFFDLSIPIPDYVPNGMINVSNINGALSFENYSWLHSESVSTGSIDYDGRIGSDTVDPSINSFTYSQGTRDYPSIIINGNITDDVQLDYVTFQVKWPNSSGYDSYDSFIIPSSAIDETGDFSIEYTPPNNNWQYVNEDLDLHAAMAFDSSNNFTLYNDIDISGYFRSGNSNWIPVFYEEYERYDADEWYFRFNLDEATIGYGQLFDANQNGGSYANLTDEVVSFNGIDIPSKTIINPDGSIVQPSDNFFNNNNNSYDASEIRIYTSLGNDYVNLSGSQQNISARWSPGNDTFIFDLNEEKYWHSPEFSANWDYNDFVDPLNVSNPNGLIFNNNNGPALEVFSDYGKTLAFGIQEIETTLYDDTIIGRDNFEEDIRLFRGNDTITSGYGHDIIRTKPHDTDANSNFLITDYSSYDSIEITDITDLDFNNYWNDFVVSYSEGNTHIGITSNEYNFTNDSLFEIVGEKSLRFIEVVNEGDGEHRVEFELADNNDNFSLKEYTSTTISSFRISDNRDSIYIKDYDPGQLIGIEDAYTRFGITDKNFLNYVSIEKDAVNNLTKLSINNETENFNNFIVIDGLHDLQGYGLGRSADYAFVSFGSDETLGTEQSDIWLGNMHESNNFDGLGGDDELMGGWVNDVLSGGSGDDRISGTLGANVLDGGDGFDTLRGYTSYNYHINLTNNTLTYLENGHFKIYTGSVLEAAGLSKDGANVLQVDAYYRVYESSDSPGDTLFQEFEKPNNGHWSKVGEAFIGTGSIDLLTGLSHSFILNSWEQDSLYREMQHDFNVTDVTTFSNFEEFEGSFHASGDLIDGRDATQSLSIIANDGDDIVYGSAFSDTINDGYGDDTIYGMGGDDVFKAQSGGDTFHGGTGTDTVIVDYSRSLPDDWTKQDYGVVNLQEGTSSSTYNPTSSLNDIFLSIENYYQTGTNGANYMVTGSDANNILSTSLGDDIIDGGAGNDKLYGNEGNDILKTGSGDDKLYGGSGDDILEATGSGHQYFDGGEGNDTFKVDINQYTLSDGFISLTDLSSGFHGSKADPDHALNDILANIENVDLSGSYDAEIIGNDENNVLISGSGNDVIAGGLGNDIIDGGRGNDVYVQEGSSDEWSIKFNQNWEWVNSTPETIHYTVTVAAKSTGTGYAYYLNGIEAPELTFKEGNTYIFDISDPTERGHPFAFSDGPDGSHGSGSSYTTNVTNNGTTIEITIDDKTPDLHYYCTAHPGMGSSAEVSLINFGNFILSNGIDINILNDIESIQFEDKTIDLHGDDGGRSHFVNTDGQDVFAGSWWEDYLDLSAGGLVTSGFTLDTSLGTVVDGFGNIDTFSSIEVFGGTSFDDIFIGSNTDDSIPQWYNALNLNHDNYEAFKPGDGADTIDGRGGYDEVNYTDSPSGMTIDLSQSIVTDGWGNDDTIANIEGVEATQYDDIIVGTSGNNSLDGRFGNNQIDGGGGFDYVEYNGPGRTNVVADLSTNTVTFAKSSDTSQTFTDTLSNIEGVIGSSSDDIITGNDQNNILEGAKGNDVIRGGEGNDVLVTGHGDDELYGDGGDDTLITVGSGTQFYDGGDGTDTLIVDTSYLTSLNPDYSNTIDIDLISGDLGQQGNPQLRDTITNIENVTYQGLFDVHIFGNDQSNIIYGDSGNDNINGKGGDDYLYGREGDDTILIGGSGNAYLDGGEGIDTFRVGLQNMDWPKTDDPDNLVNYKYTVNLEQEVAGNDTVVNFENVDYFGEYDSEITGDEKDNVIFSSSGDDVLRGGAGNDTLNAGAGNDFLYGEEGDDTLIFGGSGITVFDGGEGNDTVYIGLHSSRETIQIVDFVNGVYREPTDVDDPRYDTFTNVENFEISNTDSDVIMTGDDNDNVLTTDGGNDVIDGGAGDDTLNAGSGDDHLIGGEGNDTLILGGSGDSILDGGAGIDTFKVDLSNWTPSIETYPDPFDYDNNNGFVYKVNLEEQFAGSKYDPNAKNNDTLIDIENVDYTGPYNAELTGDINDNVIIGGSGDDILTGGVGNDTLMTGAGDDEVFGGEGDDLIIQNGSGVQHYDGGEGLDTYVVDLESENWPNAFADDFIVEVNLVTGFSGVHLNHNHPLNDTLVNMENITLKGDVNSVLIGDNNDNIINGGSGDDILRGGAGNDILKSGYGNDYVYGDRGNDVLILNGSGTQEFDGGEGIDTFKIDHLSWTSSLNPDYDQIIEIDLVNGISGQKDNPSLRDTLKNIEHIIYEGSDYVEMTGDGNNNIIKSDAGNDILRGGDGNDVLKSGDGNDYLYGGQGNDVLILNGSGVQYYDGGEGVDKFKIDHSNWTGTLDPGYDQIIEIDLVNNISGQKGNPSLRDTILNIENISYKGHTNVEMTGDNNSNVIRSARGDDFINAMDGDDFINSGRGFDTIITGSGFDTILLKPEQSSYTIETTKTIVDFVKGEDLLALEGISFEEISINQGTMDFSSHVILSTTNTAGEISYLGVLENLDASDLNINDFTENAFAQKDLTTSIEKWGGGASSWLDGPVMKLHRKDIASNEDIDLLPKSDTPGHKHKPDMDKGTYELRVEHDQNTDGAINIDDVMGVLSLSRGITQTTSDEHNLAADWNGDGLINIDDVMGVLSRSRGMVREDEWRFYDKSSDTSLWDKTTKTNKMDIVLEEDKDIELSAILRGDVNGSYKADQHDRPDPSPAPTPNAAPLPLNNNDDLLTINPDIV